MDRLQDILEIARKELDENDRLREEYLRLSRDCIRNCREAIWALHRGDDKIYASSASDATKILLRLEELVGDNPLFWHRGSGFDAQQEVVEVAVSGAIIKNLDIPTPEKLHVTPLAWLHGLGDTIGEIRREVLELIRRGDVKKAEELFSKMEEAYGGLSTFNYPDALTNNLRRKIDVARSLVERTHGEVVTALRQKELEERLGNRDLRG